LNKIYKKLIKKLFFAAMLRPLIEGYLESTISTIYSIQHMKGSSIMDYLANSFSVAYFFGLIIFPFLSGILLS